MNRNIRITFAVGLLFSLADALFPPWRYEAGSPYAGPIGRAFVITSGPSLRNIPNRAIVDSQIDGGRLLSELAIISAVTGLAVCAFSKRSDEIPTEND